MFLSPGAIVTRDQKPDGLEQPTRVFLTVLEAKGSTAVSLGQNKSVAGPCSHWRLRGSPVSCLFQPPVAAGSLGFVATQLQSLSVGCGRLLCGHCQGSLCLSCEDTCDGVWGPAG